MAAQSFPVPPKAACGGVSGVGGQVKAPLIMILTQIFHGTAGIASVIVGKPIIRIGRDILQRAGTHNGTIGQHNAEKRTIRQALHRSSIFLLDPKRHLGLAVGGCYRSLPAHLILSDIFQNRSVRFPVRILIPDDDTGGVINGVVLLRNREPGVECLNSRLGKVGGHTAVRLRHLEGVDPGTVGAQAAAAAGRLLLTPSPLVVKCRPA